MGQIRLSFPMTDEERKSGEGRKKKLFRLFDISTEEVSLVDRAANKEKFLIVKRDQGGDVAKDMISGAVKDAVLAQLKALAGRVKAILDKVKATGDDTALAPEIGNELQALAGEVMALTTPKEAAGKQEKRPPTKEQTLIFSKDRFDTADKAKAWARDHGFRADKVDEKEDTFRIRQRDPGDFDEKSFKTIPLTDGVQAVIGHLAAGKTEKDDGASARPTAKAATAMLTEVLQEIEAAIERVNVAEVSDEAQGLGSELTRDLAALGEMLLTVVSRYPSSGAPAEAEVAAAREKREKAIKAFATLGEALAPLGMSLDQVFKSQGALDVLEGLRSGSDGKQPNLGSGHQPDPAVVSSFAEMLRTQPGLHAAMKAEIEKEVAAKVQALVTEAIEKEKKTFSEELKKQETTIEAQARRIAKFEGEVETPRGEGDGRTPTKKRGSDGVSWPQDLNRPGIAF